MFFALFFPFDFDIFNGVNMCEVYSGEKYQNE